MQAVAVHQRQLVRVAQASNPSRSTIGLGAKTAEPAPMNATLGIAARRRAVPKVATIGVYEANLESFLATLRDGGVTLVIDVRQRRGVRGRDYAWANARRLQAALAAAGIGYVHRKDLAPTTALRQLQYAEDDRQGVGKRSRKELAPAYAEGYRREILDAADLDGVLPAEGLAALLCVERDPEACHRSLVASSLAGDDVLHLRPARPRFTATP